jgi:hypothetical protein
MHSSLLSYLKFGYICKAHRDRQSALLIVTLSRQDIDHRMMVNDAGIRNPDPAMRDLIYR